MTRGDGHNKSSTPIQTPPYVDDMLLFIIESHEGP